MPKLVGIIFFILATLAFFTAFNYYQISSLQKLLPQDNGQEEILALEPEPKVVTEDSCGVECKQYINQEISKTIATISATPKVITSQPGSQISKTQVTYISLSGPISTTSTDWTDVPGTEVDVNIGDYGKSPVVTWEASIKIANASGEVIVRLYDDTNKIAVVGSEILNNTANYMTIYSGNLNLWAGKNKYKVQIKSLNSQEATFGSGRIKIIY